MSEKVTMNLTTENIAFVKQLAHKTGMNNTSVVNHAISLEQYVRNAIERGAKLLIEESDGKVKEVLIR